MELDIAIVDQQFYVNNLPVTVREYLDSVDHILNQIQSTGDFEIGANTVRSMSSIGHAIGISKAKLLHGMWTLWKETQDPDGNSFFIYAAEFCNMQTLVVQRYIQAWEAVLIAPKALYDDMVAQPMKNLNALGAAVAQGFEISDDTWKTIATSSDNQTVLRALRDVKGKEPRSNSITIYLETDGSLVAWQNGLVTPIGYLDPDSNPKAIERIIKNSGIVRRD